MQDNNLIVNNEANVGVYTDPYTGFITSDTRSKIILNGDLSGLDNVQLEAVAMLKCQKLGLDFTDNPFLLLTLNGKKSFIATKKVANHFISTHKLTVQILMHEVRYRKIKLWSEKRGDFYNEREYVHISVRVSKPDGNFVEKNIDFELCDMQGVPLVGDKWANAIMKAETKVTDRAVYALVGQGLLSVDEASSIEGARITSIAGANIYTAPQAVVTPSAPVEDPRIAELRAEVVSFFKEKDLGKEYIQAYRTAVKASAGTYEAILAIFNELKSQFA